MTASTPDIQQLLDRARLISEVNRKQALLAKENNTKLLKQLTSPK
jgi:hypothetical protein